MNGEFNYEREIRLDEERIARYFDNLPLFLDLPGENQAIFERISRNANEKVGYVDSPDALRHTAPAWESDGEDPAQDDFSRSDRAFFRPEDYDMLDMLDGISCAYSECFALCGNCAAGKKYLAVICQCGKTLARISDLIYAGAEEADLRVALAKRSLHDLNDLAFMLEELPSYGYKESVRQELDILQMIRQKVLNILFEMHKN